MDTPTCPGFSGQKSTMTEVDTNDPDIPKIKLDGDYQVGPFTFVDMYKIILNELRQSSLFKSIDYENFLFHLRRGDDYAVIIAASCTFLLAFLVYQLISYIFQSPPQPSTKPSRQEEEEEKEPPRDFTIEQLRDYDGSDGKPIYIGLKGDVFDVSSASQFYGKGSSYNCFAGREATRAMARLSFEEEDLSSTKTDDLGPFERSTLEDWYDKFKYLKCYPIVGRVSSPPGPDQVFTKEELASFNGTQAVPPGRIDAPIYIAINGKVLDVSYGGKAMYGVGGPYHLFVGHDASRALAKMSLNPQDLANSDLSDLTEKELKVLGDWESKFLLSKKYPVVGVLKNSSKE